jgi:hypothetical protein
VSYPIPLTFILSLKGRGENWKGKFNLNTWIAEGRPFSILFEKIDLGDKVHTC